MSTTIQIIILILLLALSAFFSSSETALTMVSRVRLEALAAEGNKRARTVLKITDQRAKMLSTILVGNNIVNISATALSTSLAIRLFGDVFVSLATGILTVVVLIFAEITPKNLATVRCEAVSMYSASIILFLMKILTPVIFVVEKICRGLVRLLGVDPDARPAMTETELRALVSVSEEDGVIEQDEKYMINNVVDLQDTVAREIMTPRIDMTEVPVSITYDELIDVFREHHFTRMPVYDSKVENVIGIINIKDLLTTGRDEFDIRHVMSTPYFTYETKNISDLLDEMRLKSLGIVIVLDEYGNASGLLTMEDVLEEIVGDIHDEYKDRDTEEITVLRPGKEYAALGSTSIDDVNEATGLDLTSDDYDTIGGYVIEHADDKLPKVGEYIVLDDGTRMIVEAVRKNRIIRVHIFLAEKKEPEEE